MDTILPVENAEPARGKGVPTPRLVPLNEGPNFKAFTKVVAQRREFQAMENFWTVHWIGVHGQSVKA